jgi:hypothetical protein
MESVISSMKEINLLSDAAALSQIYSNNFREVEKKAYWLFKAAEIHLMNSEPLQAIKSLEPVKTFLSKKDNYNLLMAKCFFDSKQNKKSFDSFKLVNNIVGLWDWFNSAISIKNYDEAISALVKILEKDGGNEEAIYQMAVIHSINNSKESLKELRNKYLERMDKTDKKEKFRALTIVPDEIKNLFKSNIADLLKETDELEEVSSSAISKKVK